MATEDAVHDIMRAREREALTSTSDKLGWRNIAASIGYVALYLALDRLSFIGALHGVGITPWNPTAGLSRAALGAACIFRIARSHGGPYGSGGNLAARRLSGRSSQSFGCHRAP